MFCFLRILHILSFISLFLKDKQNKFIQFLKYRSSLINNSSLFLLNFYETFSNLMKFND